MGCKILICLSYFKIINILSYLGVWLVFERGLKCYDGDYYKVG